jgi:hypothetical protein
VKNQIFAIAKEFTATSHGSSSYDEDHVFVRGSELGIYVPLTFLTKKIPTMQEVSQLQALNFIYSSCDFLDGEDFYDWYKNQFGKKLTSKQLKTIGVLHQADAEKIMETIQEVSRCYSLLKKHFVINNGKNMPVQLAEWYAKVIFGLRQVKSTSQRGFDFYNSENKHVEVMVDWNDRSSPKGAKLKKSLVELSDFTIIMYINTSFLIRDLVYLDSSFIMRKYDQKGHTLFLKDTQLADYFFSVSDKHYNKITSMNALLEFSTPALKTKITAKSQPQ